jgi:sucrose phosphorylase
VADPQPSCAAATRGAQLVTYPDSLGGGLAALADLLDGPLGGLFPAGVHVLPPFPSSGDRGFAPLTYDAIDPAFGTWDDLARVGGHGGLLLDVMVNHISRRSAEFAEFARSGRASAAADLFITLDKIWPDGQPPAADVARIFLRKPEHPFTDLTIDATGEVERIWTTFGPRADWSEQIDLDLRSPATLALIGRWFAALAGRGATAVRLDAVGYVTKRAGTSCFFVEPEIWEHLAQLERLAAALGLDVLPEVHADRSVSERLAAHGYWTYDFVLPALVLHTFLSGDVTKLAAHLRASPDRQVTTLDTHDGIPVQPDLDGILTTAEARVVVEHCLARGANLNRVLLKPGEVLDFDAHQINCTYPDACGTDDLYVAARAIQLFAPGRPQVYYVGLLGGSNDHEAVAASGEGRSINRHDYTSAEVHDALASPLVGRLRRLLSVHNNHPGFAGSLSVSTPAADVLVMKRSAGGHTARLTVDVNRATTLVELAEGEVVQRWMA